MPPGNVTCTDTSKQSDFANFKSTMETVIKANYPHLSERVACRLVACDSICKDVLVKLAAYVYLMHLGSSPK